MDNLISFHQSDFLAGIKEECVADILNQGQHIQLKPGEILFMQGDSAHKCHLVLNGRLKLIKVHEQGKETIIRYITPGQVTAAIAVFKEKEYPVTAQAIGSAAVVSWSKNTMVDLMYKYPPLAVNMLQVAIDRLDDIQNRYLELLAEQVEQRVARALLRIMKQSGKKTSDGIEIGFPLSRQELADYTGTTVYTVSRILSVWGKKGWITSGREKITVVDPHALVLFAENA
jgi:CRP-like cAMP-binding protein